MSQKNKLRQAKRAEREEKQAKRVITWLFAVLVFFALAFLGVFMFQSM